MENVSNPAFLLGLLPLIIGLAGFTAARLRRMRKPILDLSITWNN
jgi:hypothetical protein